MKLLIHATNELNQPYYQQYDNFLILDHLKPIQELS